MTPSPPAELEEARQALATEAEEAVRVVLEDGRAARPRQLDEAVPVRLRERAAARVLEGRDRVDRLGPEVAASERSSTSRSSPSSVSGTDSTSAPRRRRISSERS